MISNFFNPQPHVQPQPKSPVPSPFFMFLADQHTNGKSSDMRLVDVAGDAIKEWDEKPSLQDEYTVRSLEEAEKYNLLMSSNNQLPAIHQPQANFAFDSNGKPIPPERPLSGFLFFKNDCYDQAKRENPDLRMTELTKLIAQKWRNMTQEVRDGYHAKYQEAKTLYQQQIALFEATYGKI